MKNRNNGFTLVELLAVIVILAIILVIAVPKVMSVINDTKESSFISTVKMIATAAEKKSEENKLLSKNEIIDCTDVVKLNSNDYYSCSIIFENDVAKVIMSGKGKFNGFNVCGGSKDNVTVINSYCDIPASGGAKYILDLYTEDAVNNSLKIYELENDNFTGIRYVGNNPSNKIYFNCKDVYNGISYGDLDYEYGNACEIWRIVGVFDTKRMSEDGIFVVEKRMKIIRDVILRENGNQYDMFWNSEQIAQWGPSTKKDGTNYGGASLMKYLNEDFYNSLSSVSKSFIGKAVWHTGAIKLNNPTLVENSYFEEKENMNLYDSGINYILSHEDNVGLIYPSDYGFASLECTNMYASSCGNNNWLNVNRNYWAINTEAHYNVALRVTEVGELMNCDIMSHGTAVRPVVYLKPNVKIVDGNGNSKPFSISLN